MKLAVSRLPLLAVALALLGLSACVARGTRCCTTDQVGTWTATGAPAEGQGLLAAEPSTALPAPTPNHLDTLVAWMTGSFSSAAQAAEDDSYFDIRLFVAPVWSERGDGRWLYVEQAAGTALERPYRQRIYRVRHVGRDLYESEIYSLPDAKAAVGAWKQPTPFAELTPADLTKLPGCAVLLRRIDAASFQGSTLGSACKNSFGKASYATSEVTLRENGMVSWDRGYDESHAQVWGAEKAGYRFLKVAEIADARAAAQEVETPESPIPEARK